MAKQTINPGIAPTGAGGDTFRSGSAKLQANDDELYAHLGAGDGSLTAAKTRTALGLGTAATATLTTSTVDTTLNRVLKVGDYGLGALPPDAGTTPLHQIPAGFFKYPNGSSERPPNVGIYDVYGIVVKRQSQDYGAAIWLPYTTSGNQIVVTAFSSSIRNHHYLRTDRNTTVDANGFIKNASPIIQLFADRIELNDEAKQQEIAFKKLGTGNYLIKGSSGFAQTGWYVETPKDANGNVLFSVIYTTLENGDISVKTYKKKFDIETASIVADLENPVDITENRWIDIRLQELPQPEIEEPESVAPPEFQPTGLAEAVATVMESYNDTEQ